MEFAAALPIDTVLGELRAALVARNAAVLIAPPGAGKTTRVPLALMDEAWLAGRKILVLEPRRIAARGAAERMAHTLGEAVGQRVGLRTRLMTKVSAQTRIEVVTEGIFTRMILDDPELHGVGAVLFDEFHERSLDADLGLALALDCQSALREDLRIVPMSATLDGGRVAQMLGDAPAIVSEGRAYPVETRYVGRDANVRMEDRMTDAVLRALREERGSILAFLPGQGEIRRVEERLRERITDASVILAPLYGAMDVRAQDLALEPAADGTRKVVLATSIAETSITIEGVRIVIDSGLARVPRFEPDVGVTRLETVRTSRASADQRRGRAGRTEPGVCYRLWDEAQTQSLPAFAEPEIRSADLASLLLDCAEWGANDPRALRWLDTPSQAAIDAAREELQALAALDGEGRITPGGRALRSLPLPPRLARMIIAAAEQDCAQDAADIAAVMVERGLGGNDVDLDIRLENFRRDRGRRATDMRKLAAGWARAAEKRSGAQGGENSTENLSTARLLALAYPDRLGKARGARGQFLLANGRGAVMDALHPLARSGFIVAAELSGAAAATRILLCAGANEADVLASAEGRVHEAVEVDFDPASSALRARHVRRLDAIVLASEPRAIEHGADTARAFAEALGRYGIERLPWSKPQQQLRERLAFLRSTGDDSWPDLSTDTLAARVADWLAPFLNGKSRLADIGADDLGSALDALLPWNVRRRIDDEAPTHFEAPTGNRHAIDYGAAGGPALHIRVQELFGLKQHPALANGKLPLTLHLLSPAHRPIQITRDLPGFWRGSWAAVKAEMKGRYPRHPWPDDPASALPTARAKPRGT
ncbi:ATP-dependent helicase HrpB [Hyphomicrobium sulfonivorans]|uniref:ATP-dependent helicase HrpB n=1 Tax=Hyphomicrobium sulfonivorans TaxID=121290 RepID=UPI0015712802|nr:ATP-dependent helicase HrpB [Hyphomicrobium sulfonivorans]MBI1650316.1 ATP-dependent helicase HrpB [Hyphomicrobium sulfonivorans]NSL72321.1 ATP-dependent helicase HrpB [Hyphomicrobium sulfonivorans]